MAANKSLLCFTMLLTGLLPVIGGCSREHYRIRADRDVAEIYAQKRAEEAYTLPLLDGIDVDPRSRFFDPSPEDCPALPVPEPRLFDYQLPDLVTGDPNQPPPTPEVDQSRSPVDSIELLPPEEPTLQLPEPVSFNPASEIETASWTDLFSDGAAGELPLFTPENAATPEVRLAELIRAKDEWVSDAETEGDSEDTSSSEGFRIVPIPQDYWAQLPETCVPRMLEFESVQKEFRKSFPDASTDPVQSLLSDAPRLTLPMIVELASLNNRDIQTRKETLYRVALRLTAERYEYVLRPTRRGNGTEVNYSHFRVNGGPSVSGLAVPTRTTVRKTTAIAGQFLASFANRVVMTFNGPSGFTADIGTDLLFEFQQTIFQRDVVFEDLTQAERDVIYAARDLIRNQRLLFVDLARDYYGLLLSYRRIEIRSQDYFSNLRAFLQGRAEYLQAGRIPRVQVDQFEQRALDSRFSLVGDCNSLESALDRLKFSIGLPPELSLNLDLSELDTLTTSDELTVTRQLVMRSRQTLVDAAQNRMGDRDAAVNGATVLINRLSETLRVRRRIEGRTETNDAERETGRLRRRLALLEARLVSDELTKALNRELRSDLPSEARVFFRTTDLIAARLAQARNAVRLRYDLEEVPAELETSEIDGFEDRLQSLNDDWDAAVKEPRFDQMPILVSDANQLLKDITLLTKRFVGDLLPADEAKLEDLIVTTVADTVELVDRVETSEVGGLDDVVVQENDAMILALYQRLDLMNQRGDLADDRRRIKLAADDLKAILDIRAAQLLSYDRSVLDNSTTELSLALDTPLNRRIERNVYRAALIDYQAGRRALIELEDEIKLDVREDLRQLRLLRNQYEISVASAALAYERVVSTRLQLQLAVGNVVARDFLEAQQAYTGALNDVARDHINFILRRISLFSNTESIRLDDNGYWSVVREDTIDLPPLPDFYDANPNPYGRLPDCLRYSDEVRQNH